MDQKILGLGCITVDRQFVVQELPSWERATYISTWSQQQGGLVATAMVAASKMGIRTEVIGGVGDDDLGKYALEQFREANVEWSRVVVFSGVPTAMSIVLVQEGTGERSIMLHKGVQEMSDLKVESIDLSSIWYLLLDGYWFDTAIEVASRAKQHGIIVIMDTSSSLLTNPLTSTLLGYVDYLIPGIVFARRLAGQPDGDIAQVAHQLLEFGPGTVIVTNGEQGCFVATGDESYHVPAFVITPVDTTGAGDTFHGAFIAGLAHGYTLKSCVFFASAVAAIKWTRPGGQRGIPSLEEVMQFLTEHEVELQFKN